MAKYLKRFLLIVSILVVVLAGGALLLASVFEKAIGEKLVKTINSQLTTKLSIEGFSLSLIRDFPSASAGFRGVTLQDTRKQTLLEAEEVSFRIGLSSVFGGPLRVNSVRIGDGALYLRIDDRGRANYDIVRPAEPSSQDGGGDTEISLQEATLSDMDILYDDQSAHQVFQGKVNDLTLSGEFSAEKFTLESQADLFSQFLEMDELRYLAEKEVAYDAVLAVDLTKGLYDIKSLQLEIEENIFRLDGFVQTDKTGTEIDVECTNEKGDLEAITQLLPQSLFQYLGNLTSSGEFFFNAKINGRLEGASIPAINAHFGLKDGRLGTSYLEDALTDVSFEASFSNGRERRNASSYFEIKNFRGFFNREPLDLSLAVSNLDDPLIDFSLDGVLPMKTVAQALGNPQIKSGEGEVEVQGLKINGRYSDMVRVELVERVRATGAVVFDDASLAVNDQKMLIDRGTLTLNGNDLSLRDLVLQGPGNDITLNGYCNNLLPVLFADSTNSQNALLTFESTLEARTMDIDNLIALTLAPVEETKLDSTALDSIKTEQTQNRGLALGFLNGTFAARVAEFNYGKVQGEDFNGTLVFQNSHLQIAGRANAMGGNFNLNGDMNFEGKPVLQAKFDCKGVDVAAFFEQTDNFGQTMLTNRNVSGKMTAKIAIFAYFDEAMNLIFDDLLVFAGLGIENGELKNFGLLQDMSAFVKVEDLKQIKFVNLQNFFEIRKGKLFIPAMFIQSNAMNLTISGDHSFDNKIDYNIKVNAGQVVAQKFKKHNPKMEPIKAQENGFVNLYFKIFGTVDKFDYKTAKKEVKRDFDKSLSRKEDIRDALAEAFGSAQLIEEPGDWDDAAGEPEYIW